MDHLCPRCKTALRVSTSRYVLKSDKLYMVQELVCRNPQCEKNGEVIETIEHELSYEKE